jgi:hypothetical protein
MAVTTGVVVQDGIGPCDAQGAPLPSEFTVEWSDGRRETFNTSDFSFAGCGAEACEIMRDGVRVVTVPWATLRP